MRKRRHQAAISGRRFGREGNGGSVIDPVMSADTNLDYKVTPDEFIAYSRNKFKELDTDHTGKLSLLKVTAVMCGADQGHDKH